MLLRDFRLCVEVWKYVPKAPGIAHSSHFLKCGGVVVGQALYRTGCEHNLDIVTCERCIY